MGPPILSRLRTHDDPQLTLLIKNGLPTRGMPPTKIADPELTQLVAHLRRIQRRERPVVRRSVQLVAGGMLEGQVAGEGFDDLQLRTDDKRIHLLRRAGDRYREVTSEVGWPTYNGETGGNRFTTLTKINKKNIASLAPKWVLTVPNAGRLQGTPVVVDGIMYVTAPNQCIALDAGTGRQIWRYQKARQPGMTTAAGSNRGVGVAGDRVFMETDHAHIIALNRFTGELLWDSEIADWRQLLRHIGASSRRQCGVGVGGGEHGANGVLAAFDQATGKEVWRFHTVPGAANPDLKRGKGGSPRMGARRPGSREAMTQNWIRFTGRQATRAKNIPET